MGRNNGSSPSTICWTRCWDLTTWSTDRNTPDAVPAYKDNHQKWEEKFSLWEKSQSPQQPFKTPEPQRKMPKLSSKPSVKHKVNLKPKATLHNTLVKEKFRKLHLATLPWQLSHNSLLLFKRCPRTFKTSVKIITTPWAYDLIAIECLFYRNKFTQGKIQWLGSFPQFEFSVACCTFDIC